jgi:saccharopine dehydrogenase (NAD+, L-lysine forming)
VRSTERRTAILLADARSLVQAGIPVTVEDFPQRVFPIADYAAAGCRIAAPGSWVDAPDEEFIVRLKELPDAPAALHCTTAGSSARRCSRWRSSRWTRP